MKMARENVKEILQKKSNRIFGATFTKKDGSTRKMTARLGVKFNLKGGKNNVMREDRSYLTVFDMHKRAYRSLNLRTLTELKMNGKMYEII